MEWQLLCSTEFVECGEPIKHFHRMQEQWLRVPEERVGVWWTVVLKQQYNGTPPYSNSVNTTASLLWPLYTGANITSLKGRYPVLKKVYFQTSGKVIVSNRYDKYHVPCKQVKKLEYYLFMWGVFLWLTPLQKCQWNSGLEWLGTLLIGVQLDIRVKPFEPLQSREAYISSAKAQK